MLTYFHARRTVLQPIKTEVFKLQLRTLNELLKLFVGKGEHDLRSDARFEEAFYANCCMMYDAFAEIQFDRRPVDKEDRPYSRKYCPSILAHRDALRLDDKFHAEATNEASPKKPTSWSEYRNLTFAIPIEMSAYQDELTRILQDPLLPRSCRELLDDYLNKIRENVQIMSEVIGESAQHLPEEFPTFSSMSDATYSWIHNRWNGRAIQLSPTAEKIIEACREHFKVDEFDIAKT